MNKVCAKCKQKKELSEKCFRLKRKKEKNEIIEYWDSWCITCSNNYSNLWMKERNKLLKQNNQKKYYDFLLKQRINNRRSKNKGIAKISNSYLAFVLDIKMKDLKKYSQEFIEAKRIQIQLHRTLYPQHKNLK